MTESLSTVAVEPIHDSSDYNERTQNVLVILTDTEVDQRLIHEAGAYAAGIGSHLILLSVMPSREFEERQRVYAQTRDLPRYSLPQARETCRQSALRSSRELLNTLDPDIEYTAVGAVGRETDQVLATARAYDCGHVFLVDQPRSLLRRFLGSGGIRAITRGFDGLVTTLREPHHL